MNKAELKSAITNIWKTRIDETFSEVSKETYYAKLMADTRPNKHGYRENQYEVWLTNSGKTMYIISEKDKIRKYYLRND